MRRNRLDQLPDFAVIIQSVHERGDKQQAALIELEARGLWLSLGQQRQAGLVSETGARKPVQAP